MAALYMDRHQPAILLAIICWVYILLKTAKLAILELRCHKDFDTVFVIPILIFSP